MQALQTGEVKPEGMELTFLPLMMPEPGFRMLRHREFDAAEMSLSWYTRTLAQDPRPLVAIPVFPSRMFRHSCIYVNSDSGIEKPQDLIGKRVGCPEYQMTAAVWIKGILADHHNVPVDSVRYLTGGLEQPGRTETPKTPMSLPDTFDIRPIPRDRTLSQMLAVGELDALYTAHRPSSFDDSSGRVRRLWEDPVSIERQYFHETGIFPIMHVVALRADVYAAKPWIAQSLTKAFEESKARAQAALYETTALKYMIPWLTEAAEKTRSLMGDDPFFYGLEGNETTLRTFLRYSFEQGLSPRQWEPEDLFAPETLDVAKI